MEEQHFKAIDNAANVVATFTGIKAQFIEAGWAPAHAEMMVIEILRSANIEKMNPTTPQ